MELKFDRRSGQYRNLETGRFVPRADVLRLVEEETLRGEVRLKAIARLLIAGRIDLPEFQERFAEQLKASHLRLGMLSSGGKEGVTKADYGAVGKNLRDEYKYLRGFGQAIAAGELNPEQIVKRAASYGQSARISFFSVEKQSRKRNGVNQGRRDLDPQSSKHCADCLRHATHGWVGIDQIVPVGTKCLCRQRCRCRISWRAFVA